MTESNQVLNPITIKRLKSDYIKFMKSGDKNFVIYPNESNMLEIYFLMYGLKDTMYQGGEYIGMIKHNPDYPFKAPNYYMLTPSGRFEINKGICLTNSSFHQNDWMASWSLSTLLEGFFSIWHSDSKEDKTGIAHITYMSDTDLKIYAIKSIEYNEKCLNEIYSKLKK